MAALDSHVSTAAGTLGGTLTTLLANVESPDIVRTIILSCIGAVVSFVISMVLKWVARKYLKE